MSEDKLTIEQISSMNESYYIHGRRSAFRTLLVNIANELEGDESNYAKLLAEITETRAALREVCRALGCDKWPNELWLPDVVEKHLGRAVTELIGGVK